MVSQSAFWFQSVTYLIAMAHQDSFPIDVRPLKRRCSDWPKQRPVQRPSSLFQRTSEWCAGATGRTEAFPMTWRCRAWRELRPARSSLSLSDGLEEALPLRVPDRRDDSGAFFLSGDEGPALRAGERVHVPVLRKWVLAGRSNRGRQNPAAGAVSHKCAEHLEDGGCPVGDQRSGIS